MHFDLKRTYSRLGTFGKLVGEGFECCTIERPQTGDHPCIPEGTYRLERYDSPKHGPRTWQFVGVPGRNNIQIHTANWPHELLGCVALGEGHQRSPAGEPGVIGSAITLARFVGLTSALDAIEIIIS
jgi:hypothetical protein